MTRRGWTQLAVGVALGAVILAGLVWLPLDAAVLALAHWIRDAGAVGVVAFMVLYVSAVVMLLPGSMFTLVAGFAYGPLWGTAVAWPSAVMASIAAFSIGRYLARDWVHRRVSGDPRYAAIDAAVAHNGLRITALLRLSPVTPYNLLNYALGGSSVRARDYLLASPAMLPGTALYVYIGSLVPSAAELVGGETPDAGAAGNALYWGGLAATAAVAVLLTRMARKALAEALVPPQ